MPYDDDGLALVRLARLLVGSGCDDAGQADGYRNVNQWLSAEIVFSFSLRGRLILDIIRRRRTVLLKGASVRPVALSAHSLRGHNRSTYEPGTCIGVPTA